MITTLMKFLLNNIERIEILKGNQSSLYGSQAIGGVINLTSKKPTKDDVIVLEEKKEEAPAEEAENKTDEKS